MWSGLLSSLGGGIQNAIKNIRHVFNLRETCRRRQPEAILRLDDDVRIAAVDGRPEDGPASSCQSSSAPPLARSSENCERGGKLIFVRDAAVDLANALNLVARGLVA
jgi:hypothetical protein